jgi:hypothetical protein
MVKLIANALFVGFCVASLICFLYYKHELVQQIHNKKEQAVEVEPKTPTDSYTPKLINEKSI